MHHAHNIKFKSSLHIIILYILSWNFCYFKKKCGYVEMLKFKNAAMLKLLSRNDRYRERCGCDFFYLFCHPGATPVKIDGDAWWGHDPPVGNRCHRAHLGIEHGAPFPEGRLVVSQCLNAVFVVPTARSGQKER